jgi:hypothetical protein
VREFPAELIRRPLNAGVFFLQHAETEKESDKMREMQNTGPEEAEAELSGCRLLTGLPAEKFPQRNSAKDLTKGSSCNIIVKYCGA